MAYLSNLTYLNPKNASVVIPKQLVRHVLLLVLDNSFTLKLWFLEYFSV